MAWSFHRNTARWLWNVGDAGAVHPPEPAKEDPATELMRLPPPSQLETTLSEVLSRRVSCRRFDDAPVPAVALGTVLHAAYGVHGQTTLGPLEFLERAVPSAGALYPLELYVLASRVDGVAPGVWHYIPLHHGLERLREVDLPGSLLSYLFMGQPYAASAPAVLVTTAVVERSLVKYGDRGLRYLLLEAGHAGQNLALAAAAVGLGACPLGGFLDDDLAALLRADVDFEIPLYAAAVGMPADDDRNRQRAIEGDATS